MKLWLPMLVAILTFAQTAKLQAATVGAIQIKGAIGPATVSYISRAIDVSGKRGDTCLIIQLDTPGGLLDSTKDIVEKFYSSPVPTVVYVAPSSANAGSAGTFITMAADVAAMAPHSSIGAAHPVSIAPGGAAEKVDAVMKQKLESFASAYIQGIAEKRGRNAEWAMSAVKESASITAENALELNVVDLLADDLPDLLRKLDGRKVHGKELRTAGAKVMEIPMVPREKLFQTLWRPEVMFLLMLVAIYGIIGEINNPGTILPGVAGVIALVLFLYMATIIPINAAGMALIILALILFIVDVYSPTHGVLTVGGVIAFFLGALMLFNRSGPAFHLSLVYVLAATVTTALFFLFVVAAGLRAQRLPVQAGSETMIGKVVPALERIDGSGGKVFVEGEYWNAVSDVPVEKDQPVEITGIERLTLKVKPKT
ncbi:MAG TPA: nodulation protein NfeD [Candidatus Paceibacterota bacterium]|nr:nodulation protein NfeD [Candidatus Paceibacterota bacterium]